MNDRQTPPARLPVTSHHLFPAALALWFGALFGLSSLAVRAALFEQLVLSSHIDDIFPFAAPPLGHLARLLLALGFAAIGAILGLGVARIVIRAGNVPHTPSNPPADDIFRVRARDAHPDAPARRPVSARDELADAASIPMPKFHAVDDGDTRAPGTRFAWHDVGHELPNDMLATATSPRDADSEPAEPDISQPDALEHPAQAELDPVAPQPSLTFTAADRIARAHPSELSPVELIERLAIAMQRRNARQDRATGPIAGSAPRAIGAPADEAGVDRPDPSPGRDATGPSQDERIAAIETLRDTLAALRGSA